MVRNRKALGAGHGVLPLLDFGVVKLFHLAAIQAYQVVMVLAFVQLKNRLAAFKVAATEQTGLFKLGQHPVHRGQAHVRALKQQDPVNIFRCHMALGTALKNFQDFQPRYGGLEAGIFEFVNIGHGSVPARALARPRHLSRYNRAIISSTGSPMLPRLHSGSYTALLALASSLLAGCGTLPDANRVADVVSPYRIDLVQGNVVTREQFAAVRTGMPRNAVRDILGTPLLTSVFHAQRWDYVFSLKRQGADMQSRRVTVFFSDDLVERIESDPLPSEAEFVATLKSIAKTDKLPPMEASEESLKNFPPPRKPAQLTVAVPTAPSSYPPLEPASRQAN